MHVCSRRSDARSTARPEGVRLIERVEATDGGDPIMSPVQANVLRALRRALAIALAVCEGYGAQTGLVGLKKQNLEGRLPTSRGGEFAELLVGESLVALSVFANATAFLLAPHAGEVSVEVGSVEEVLTDNATLALHGCLWELDQEIARFAEDEARLVATVMAFAEQVMEKVSLRAQNAPRLEAFTGAHLRVEADGLTISGFTPARKARGARLTMSFKKPHEVVGNHIAKYQAMKLAKMLMAYDFERRLNPFAELGGFIFTFMGDGKPGTGKTTLIQMMAGLINKGICFQRVGPIGHRLWHDRRHRPARRQAGGPAVVGGAVGDHRRADGEFCRGEHGGAGQLHLRDVFQLPRECRRRAAPAGGGAVPR